MKILLGQNIGLNLVGRAGDASTRKAKPISWHTHDFFELLFVIEGETSYEFRKFHPLNIPGGSFLIIPPGINHRGLNNIRTPATLFGVTYKPHADNASQLTPLTSADLTEIQRLLQESALTVRSCSPELRRCVARLSQLVGRHAGQKDLDDMIKAKLRAAVCTVIIEAAVNLSSTPQPDHNAIVTAATEYLEAHCHEPLQISDLVHHIGFSRARIFEIFKAGTGMTPNDYLLRCRIRKARELLSDPARPIIEIGLNCGFSSSQYFSQVFKKYTGMTPSRYRRGK
ncbi:MAG: AraC family transcriptional regulator [Kiritimatiellae bacterium]|nr:AraC family transcriptional regulator [Kiritimatiellia bacterium]